MRIVALFLALAACVSAKPRPNILLLCIDDLRPELHCFGVDYIQTPRIDGLAASGRPFLSHYVQAPTCGASRYTLLTGCYGPVYNDALFVRAREQAATKEPLPPTLPGYFRSKGYNTISLGKVSHHPGGWGGEDWSDTSKLEMPGSWDRQLMPVGPWKHPLGAMHGLANGEIRGNSRKMDVFQSTPGPDTIYPDGLIANEALHTLEELANHPEAEKKPFFFAVGLIKPHLPFGSPAKYMEPYKDATLPPIPHPEKPEGITTWHGSGEFMRYNRHGKDPRNDPDFATEVRKHYAACVTYADTQTGRILDKLNELKLSDNTIVILWGDHGWHLGEHAVWGKHTLFEESLRSPLIIRYPGLKSPGKATSSVVETIDIFPTLCDLAGLETPTHLDGRSLLPQLKDPKAAGRAALSYTQSDFPSETLRNETYRLIRHREGGKPASFELYDHRNPDAETRNIAAEHPELVRALEEQLDARLKR